MKKNVVLLLVSILALAFCLPVMSQSVETEAPSVEEIDKYGDIRLAITSQELADLGFEYADYVTVSFLDQSITVPVIPAYRYVGAKASGLVMYNDDTSKPVELEVFNGSFASTYGLAERFTREDGSRYHEAMVGIEFPVAVKIEMAEKGGYKDTYAIFDLERSNNFEDYEGLSVSQFANYRMITTDGIGAGKLFRSSSPINPNIGRNVLADICASLDGVKSFINLSDSAESAAKFEGFEDSYYKDQNVLYLNLGVDFSSDLNKAGVVEMMNFLADAPTPVLVHCNEGQDRAGFVSALLECLMGASLDEVVQDYMVSFYNYYGVVAGTDQYAQLSNNIKKNLTVYMGVEDIENADLQAEAEEYLKGLGVSDETIAAVKANLSGESVQVTGHVTEIEKYGHALLDISIEDFMAAGFELGDAVTVTAGSYNDDIPFFNGYYVDHGDKMVRAYPGHEFIALCINYGKFAETYGLEIGSPVRITLREKGRNLLTQEVNSLVYTNDRADYESDEVFANFREVTTTGIGAGKLYRSASPVDNSNNRAATANALAEAAGIKTVLNLANNEEELAAYAAEEGFASDYYMSLYNEGNVILLASPINFTSDEFAEGIAKGLTFLAQHDTPYLVHCTEGKDRAGFTSMILEALTGASDDEIIQDYMQSYVNYYHIDPEKDADKYEMIALNNIFEMLKAVTGLSVEEIVTEDIDLAAAAETYLTSHGMSAEDVAVLKEKLK